MTARVLIHVQHLLGTGHLRRAARLAGALSAAGFSVDLVSGGQPVPALRHGKARLHQLPVLRATDESFSTLVDEHGRVVDEAWQNDRRDRLLQIYAQARPDVVIVETFPFGRRMLRFELLPLLERAATDSPKPVVLSSLRDLLQTGRKPARLEEAADWAEAYVDLVMVHGDQTLTPIDRTFPLAGRIAGMVRYTGYLADPNPPAPKSQRNGVVVSAGGGRVGAELLAAAIAARPRCVLSAAPWLLLTGTGMAEADMLLLRRQAPPEVTVERHRDDLPALFAGAELSISQAGYNTAVEILQAEVRAVLVPFDGGGETEQPMRAEMLTQQGRAETVLEASLTPASLARAIDAAMASPPPGPTAIDLDGAAKSVALIRQVVAARR